MRVAVFLFPLLVAAAPVLADDISTSTSPSVDAARRQARWAELEAQRRITMGDYEGAVEAQNDADASRRAAQRLEKFDRSASAQTGKH